MVMEILGNRGILGNNYNTVFLTNSVIQTVWLKWLLVTYSYGDSEWRNSWK